MPDPRPAYHGRMLPEDPRWTPPGYLLGNILFAITAAASLAALTGAVMS